jgi:hypothetical protein
MISAPRKRRRSSLDRDDCKRLLAIGFCVISLAFLSVGWSAAGQQVSRVPECRNGEWSAPETLSTSAGKYLYVERPSVFLVNKRALMIGSPAYASQGKDSANFRMEAIAGAVFDAPRSAHALSLPPGVSELGNVQTVRTGDGIVHAVWQMVGAPHADSLLWAADYHEGRWSDPIKLSTQKPYHWNELFASEPLVSGTSLEILLSIWDEKTHHPAIDVFRWRGRTVSRDRYETDPTIYLTVENVRGSTLVGYIGQNPKAIGRENNSIYIAVIPAGASQRLHGQLVSSTNGGVANDLHLLASTHSRLYLVWRYTSPEPQGPDSLQLSTSSDGGRRWTQLSGLAIPGGIEELSAALLPDGGLSLSFRQPARRHALATVDWKNGSWRSLKVLDYQAVAKAELAVLNPRRQLLTWGTFGPPGPRRFPVTLIATRELNCGLDSAQN